MDGSEKLRAMFPRGSKDFFQVNETKTYSKLPHSDIKPHKAPALDRAVPRKEKSVERVTVRYRLCRVRPLDPDNATGSVKDLTDGLCRCGLLQGDDPTRISLIVDQERVEHYSDERTEIEIDYPEGFEL